MVIVAIKQMILEILSANSQASFKVMQL